MNTDTKDVEVPVNGVVIVENGEVQEIESEKTGFPTCWCRDGKHERWSRRRRLHDDPPHIVGETTYTVVWEPRK
jgi:hypothetical protein